MFEEINCFGVMIILMMYYFEEVEFLCECIGIIDQGQLFFNQEMQSLFVELVVEIFVFDFVDELIEVLQFEGFEICCNSCGLIEVDLLCGQNFDCVFE